MKPGVCYTLSSQRNRILRWVETNAADVSWWTETSCGYVVASSSSAQLPEVASGSSSSGVPADATDVLVSGKTILLNLAFSHNVLTVNMPKQALVRVHVFDMLGNRVKTFQEAFAGSREVSLQGLPQGSYMVRVMSGSAVKTSRDNIR